ncbi:hypothetical protein ACH47Z_18120 [Streptomyces sp. NPDC020192]|uniref:hypothetical protein n=1 Tax=Streptomyces sp. NPDC020192 TaxID=3365066 RepID=UPI0037B05205
MSSYVEQQIAARIARARAEEERKRRERAELAAARAAGLERRHAQKLARLAENNEGTPMAATPFRSVLCPSCRAQRTVRRVGTATVAGSPYDVLRCPDSSCELQWLVRAERPRTAPAAAA